MKSSSILLRAPRQTSFPSNAPCALPMDEQETDIKEIRKLLFVERADHVATFSVSYIPYGASSIGWIPPPERLSLLCSCLGVEVAFSCPEKR